MKRIISLLQGIKKTSYPYTYKLVEEWPQIPDTCHLGEPAGICISNQQHIVIFHRAGRKWMTPMPDTCIDKDTIHVIDRDTGCVLKTWGAGRFIMPHGLDVDWESNLWITDVALHQIFKFNIDGKLLMQIGEAGVAGCDDAHFNRPTAVATAPDGSFYVSDGYGNSRVVKFTAAGEYLFSWGKRGKGSGEFNLPHNIDTDSDGLVYVADRENSRIQIFDADGKFIRLVSKKRLGKTYSLLIDRTNDQLIASDYARGGSDIIFFDRFGNQVFRFGRSGSYHGPVCLYHDIAIDERGDIYAGDLIGNRILKFRKTIN
jgi:peptidylamidoglycolate lyase